MKHQKIVDDMYDPKIEDPEYQKVMRSVIKAWIREGIREGIKIGKQELALELDIIIQKSRDPMVKAVVIKRLTPY